MTPLPLEEYVSRLASELRKQGLADARIVAEVRDHLRDAVTAGLQRGLSPEAAEQEAFLRFGPPELVAASFARERSQMSRRFTILLSTLGRLLRRTSPPHPAQYHDVGPSRNHVGLRLKRPHRQRFGSLSRDEQQRFIAEQRARGEDVSAFEMDPRERLARFLEEFGRRTFGPAGTLESLTLLEETTDSDHRGGRYAAAFAGGSTMIWTVALSADGDVSFDGTNAPAPLRS